ncbi:hypothetical protein HU200_023437 [Digitaria exilis]|uniref:Protein EARLY RESPONSIVE TO DEHYDRATION 15 n=1 Tax=Digitaria exilis TaxID=1010633 RepID=A0A835CBW4_9POAL|nr:hypothetical protein HU200_023437 [Digitaria exilis]CAB3495925.1 unnamed protein product [Digitaria exilis]
MSAVAVSASSLNPEAPLFIPAALLQVEDFSPQWWDLVTTTAWFRDHWSREHTQLDEMAEELDAAGLLPDDEDLFYDDLPEDNPAVVETPQETAPAVILKTDEVSKALNLTSPKGDEAPRGFWEKSRHGDKPTKYAGSPKGSSAPRVIHQPR